MAYSSLHGIATVFSTAAKSKIIDTNWSSKKYSKSQGAESLPHVKFDLFSTFRENHKCRVNFTGTSYELCATLSCLSNLETSSAM